MKGALTYDAILLDITQPQKIAQEAISPHPHHNQLRTPEPNFTHAQYCWVNADFHTHFCLFVVIARGGIVQNGKRPGFYEWSPGATTQCTERYRMTPGNDISNLGFGERALFFFTAELVICFPQLTVLRAAQNMSRL